MKRWLLRGALVAVLIAVAAGVAFEWTTRVGRGRLMGEPFYEGRPASYWAAEIERWETDDPPWDTQRYARRSTWPAWIERRLPPPGWPTLLDGDPEALPVLQALRKHPSPDVQDWARIGIERIDNDERGEIKIKHPSVIVTAELFAVSERTYETVAKAKWRSSAEWEKMEREFAGLEVPEKKLDGRAADHPWQAVPHGQRHQDRAG
jgi:hypothetical protein